MTGQEFKISLKHPVMNKIKIGMIQSGCTADTAFNLINTIGLIESAIDKGANIICLPELFKTLYFCQGQDYQNFSLAESIPGESTDCFSDIAKRHAVVILAPLFEKRAEGIYYNSIAVIDADGTLAGIYRKMHIPQDPGFDEKFYFTPGDLGYKVFHTRYGKIGTLICWDQWYPEAARLTAMMGADIIFYPTAIGWDCKEPAELGKPQLEAWQIIQRSHSIANGVFVCAVNRVRTEGDITFWGSSFVSDPFGTITAMASQDKQEVIVTECNLDLIHTTRVHWPFFRDRRTGSYQNITKQYIG